MDCDARFNTYCFLLAFLPIVLAAYWIVPSRRWKHLLLAVAGIVFYGFWDVRFAALLVAAAVVDFFVAQRIAGSARKRLWLGVSLAFNLGVLAVFKYAVFAVESARSLFDVFGVPAELPYFSIVLPVGISFFTFKTLSYTIDVYRGEVAATRDFPKYLAFICLFPDLVAGPILRYADMSRQLDDIPRRPDRAMFALGVTAMSVGLFKKVVVADTIARYVDPLWTATATLTTLEAWAAAFGYGLQLYFDFSAYSDMAIGLGAMLALRFPVNFRAPYQALNPSDFWRRWHVSLSSWLRDYLYIPLGGNRKGGRRTYVNLLLVMFLGGLWHGAAWTFVAWGMLHGLYLVLYRAMGKTWDAAPVLVQRAVMLALVMAAWVPFRAVDFATAGHVYAAMAGTNGFGSFAATGWLVAGLAAVLAFAIAAKPLVDQHFDARRRVAVAAATLLVVSIVMLDFGDSPFLYYQF
ncbi:MAG TPA: MBOAT family O-acyltransferase [Candidatus Thermoplasmatota archaeon]|nr:MBOAT family O-acyltransferase [Candidatus Thermoplasmatota archaeon]